MWVTSWLFKRDMEWVRDKIREVQERVSNLPLPPTITYCDECGVAFKPSIMRFNVYNQYGYAGTGRVTATEALRGSNSSPVYCSRCTPIVHEREELAQWARTHPEAARKCRAKQKRGKGK